MQERVLIILIISERLSIFDIINILKCLKKPNGNMRRIGISNYTKRIITYVIWNPILKIANDWIDNVQLAFKKGCGCDDITISHLIMVYF